MAPAPDGTLCNAHDGNSTNGGRIPPVATDGTITNVSRLGVARRTDAKAPTAAQISPGTHAIAPDAAGRTERIQAAQLAGSIGGGAIGILQARNARSVGSNLHLDLATAVGWQTAAGVADLLELDMVSDPQERAGIALAGGLGGYGVAAIANLSIDPPRAPRKNPSLITQL